MKISISYPPIESEKGVPLLSQNRQFQWFNNPTYIYPMVPAYAATMLAADDHEVIWDDGIAEEKGYNEWLKDIERRQPDMIVIETKTPVVKRHWRIINEIKELMPGAKTVLVGDHVTALPRESLMNSKVDYVITGGDYDFLLLNLVRYLEGLEELKPGIYYRANGEIRTTGEFRLTNDLNTLPFIDRDLTKWRLYAYKNGNFKVTPGTYTMVGRDCWWRKNGGCTFCSWTTLYPTFRVRRPELLVEEIERVVDRYGVKEVFDDTGTFPIGRWLRKFCRLMIERGLNKPSKLVMFEGVDHVVSVVDKLREAKVFEVAKALTGEGVDLLVIDGPLIPYGALGKLVTHTEDEVRALERYREAVMNLHRACAERGVSVVGFVKRPRSRYLRTVLGELGSFDHVVLSRVLKPGEYFPNPPQQLPVTAEVIHDPKILKLLKSVSPSYTFIRLSETAPPYRVDFGYLTHPYTTRTRTGVPYIIMKADEEVKISRKLLRALYEDMLHEFIVRHGRRDPDSLIPILPEYGGV